MLLNIDIKYQLTSEGAMNRRGCKKEKESQYTYNISEWETGFTKRPYQRDKDLSIIFYL